MTLLQLCQLLHGLVVDLLELALILVVYPLLDLQDVSIGISFDLSSIVLCLALADGSFHLLWSVLSTSGWLFHVLNV